MDRLFWGVLTYMIPFSKPFETKLNERMLKLHHNHAKRGFSNYANFLEGSHLKRSAYENHSPPGGFFQACKTVLQPSAKVHSSNVCYQTVEKTIRELTYFFFRPKKH